MGRIRWSPTWAFFNDQRCVRVIVEAFLLSVDSFIVRHILICRKYDIERNQGFSFSCFGWIINILCDQVILSLYQVLSSGVLDIVDGCYIKLLIAQSKNSSSCCATLCKSCNLSGESSTFNCSFSFLWRNLCIAELEGLSPFNQDFGNGP